MPLLRHLLGSARSLLLLWSIRSLAQFAAIGTSASAIILNAYISEHMEYAVSVEEPTKHKIEKTIMDGMQQLRHDPSVLPTSSREPHSLAHKRGMKGKAIDYPDSPLFHRGFTWSNLHPASSLFPAATATEFADPIPSLPKALLNNLEIQHTLWYLEPYIEV